MSFEVGRLSAALTLEGVGEFHGQLDAAGRKLQETEQKGAAFGRAGTAAFRAAAGATTGLVTAAGAYLTILTKTGVAYNSLQQNSRAALSVLLGGTEQANAQMNKLDDFARNSPFSKSVFIEAQQQLIGFGMEAGRVIPTLDAIQQGVAAMGGSNEQISEVVNILATVQSTGKFTAETLNELGYRGVDAATLMGDAMGKSAAQIREDISDAAIGGSEAIDILVGAMQDRFGGAADGVKEQWTGAVDRIKAASRDLGSHIAEPFVSAEGGGMAVTWGNQVADVLRAIEKQAVPVMGILTERSMPFFSTLTQGLDSAKQAIDRWDASSLEVSLDKLANHAPALGALAGALFAVGAQTGPLGRMFQVLGISANPVVAAFVGLAAASPEVRDALTQLLSAGKPLLPLIGELATLLSGSLNSALPLVTGGVEMLVAVLTPLLRIASEIPAPILLGVAAFLAMHRAAGPLEGSIRAVAAGIQNLAARGGVAAVTATADGVGALGYAAGVARGSVARLGDALKGAFLSNPIGIALTVVATAVGVWAQANAQAQQQVEEHKARVAELKGTLDETSGALTAASREMVAQSVASEEMAGKLKDAGVTGQAYTQALIDGGAAAKVFEKDILSSSRATLDASAHGDTLRQTAADLGISYETLIRHGLGYSDATREVDQAMAGLDDSTAEALEEQRLLAEGLTSAESAMNSVLGPQQSVIGSYREMRDSIEEAQREQQRIREAMREHEASMSDAARSNERFNDALSVARDTTQDAETRVRALKQALDELKGGALSAEEAEKRLSETNLSLAEGLAQTDENGQKLWQATLDGAGAIDLGSRAGLAFADTMGQARDRMLDAARAASDQALANGDVAGALDAAKGAGEGYIENLRQTMSDAGLTQEQINGLIGSYLDVPAVVATLLTDEGSISEVDQQVLGLISQMEGVPGEKTITVSEPMSPAIITRLENLGLKVETLPDGNIQVTESGAATVDAVLNNVARSREAVITVRANGARTATDWAGGMTRADGGLHTFAGNRPVEAFANGGGFPTGIFAGGPPIIKFAEPETGWEAFISGRKGQERRNAQIAMDALTRLGFPVVPVSALRGVPAFADGGTMSHRSPSMPASVQPAAQARRRSDGPLVGTVNLGTGVTRDQFAELKRWLDFIKRGGR